MITLWPKLEQLMYAERGRGGQCGVDNIWTPQLSLDKIQLVTESLPSIVVYRTQEKRSGKSHSKGTGTFQRENRVRKNKEWRKCVGQWNERGGKKMITFCLENSLLQTPYFCNIQDGCIQGHPPMPHQESYWLHLNAKQMEDMYTIHSDTARTTLRHITSCLSQFLR